MTPRILNGFPGVAEARRVARAHHGQSLWRRLMGWSTTWAMASALFGMATVAPTSHAREDAMGSDVLSAQRMIDHPLCRMGVGRRHAADIAVVVIPALQGGARFAVLGDTGVLFDGELPFFPNNHALGHTLGQGQDGSVLVGFGGLSPGRESMLRGDEQHAQGPVRIYRNGAVIFETDLAWQFDVASNGTSYFVLEPQTKHVPKPTIEPLLIVGNTATGTQERFDIVDQLQEINDAYGNDVYGRARYRPDLHATAYSSTEEEIMIGSRYKPVGYTYNRPSRVLFYSVAKGQSRFSVFSHHAALFASSRHGYIADECMVERVVDGRRVRRSEITVAKKQYHWSGIAEKTETVIWNRSLDLDRFLGLSLSDDGAYLILKAINLHVLDAATGETVFTFPTQANLGGRLGGKEYHWKWDDAAQEGRVIRETPAGRAYYDAALMRLANVLPPGATINDIDLDGPVAIRRGRLAMTHRIPQGTDGGIGKFRYLFDMDGIEPNGRPRVRIERSRPDQDNACVRSGSLEQGLRLRNGKLTYQTERLSIGAD